MNQSSALEREIRFVLRDRAFIVWVLMVACFSTFAVWSGLSEVKQQQKTIERLMLIDQQDRESEFTKQNSWGSAAYYSFQLTYDPPSDFAFAAMGQRDTSTWKHRMRMLALEGQIYEHDPGNPELALIGRFDFAFLAAFVLPLILIFLLHDVQASERTAGRFNLLIATAGSSGSLWWRRALPKSIGILIAALVPLFIAGIASGTDMLTLIATAFLLLAYTLLWTYICLWFASWERSAAVILASLIGVWILLTAVIPAAGRVVIDRIVPVPSGAEILMTQREAVNDAWDLPVEDTMEPFFERYPEWKGYTKAGDGFDWGWYYAFQQVGDLRTERLAEAYTTGRIMRDRLAGLFAYAAPPVLLERLLQKLAGTDMQSVFAYEYRVRNYHAELRAFYYPGLFGGKSFTPSALSELPKFDVRE